jgi:hypothetical protein
MTHQVRSLGVEESTRLAKSQPRLQVAGVVLKRFGQQQFSALQTSWYNKNHQ